jgi:hypothetical protein
LPFVTMRRSGRQRRWNTNTLRILRGGEQRRCLAIVPRSREAKVGQTLGSLPEVLLLFLLNFHGLITQ